MNACPDTENMEAILERCRCREAEVYFKGICLFRVLCNGNWRKAPFFLRNLWRSLAE
jgi:hypothetical protein